MLFFDTNLFTVAEVKNGSWNKMLQVLNQK